MKTIIAGSRDIEHVSLLFTLMTEVPWEITEVVSGGARGIDTLGEKWAKYHGIPITRFPADWNKFGKKAGYLRNAEMADYGEALVAIRLDNSKGTGHMIKLAEDRKLRIHVVNLTSYGKTEQINEL